MVPVLVAAGDIPVDTLAEMADRVADYSRAHSLNAVTAWPPATAADPALVSIENRLDAPVRRLDDFAPAHRRSASMFQSHSRSSTSRHSSGLQTTDAPRDASDGRKLIEERRSAFDDIRVVCRVYRLVHDGAVVAREYGLPCVVGIEGITTMLKSGDYVQLDGNTGVVRKVTIPEAEDN
ncbi:hypothetical protein HPB50_008997 [Hyalomma asiaticum]|uniref:Uncharacterized protein n=1 Tax=Hyalomma asiaticum TaxID=266040 RepID=A0ACB7SWQ2_HYAAI|nr:hypothetical protein HPB50_008997 [Hyalomma asiaticum]